MELEALQAVTSGVEALGASIVVISPQLEKFSKQVAKSNNLTFNVLCDAGNQVASRFGLTFSLPADLRQVYSDFGIDLERFNGEDSWTLPIPARFTLDQQGTIISVDSDPDYTVRPEPEDIVKLLQSRT